MRDTKAFWLSLSGFFAVSIIGTFCHFLYEISGNSFAVGLFTPVNESPFEHLKLLFFPFLLWGVLEYFVYGRYTKGFVFLKALGVTIGMIFTIGTFYLYSSVIGRNILPVDILLFLVSVMMAFAVLLSGVLSERFEKRIYDIVGWAILIVWCLIFWIVTAVSI